MPCVTCTGNIERLRRFMWAVGNLFQGAVVPSVS